MEIKEKGEIIFVVIIIAILVILFILSTKGLL